MLLGEAIETIRNKNDNGLAIPRDLMQNYYLDLDKSENNVFQNISFRFMSSNEW